MPANCRPGYHFNNVIHYVLHLIFLSTFDIMLWKQQSRNWQYPYSNKMLSCLMQYSCLWHGHVGSLSISWHIVIGSHAKSPGHGRYRTVIQIGTRPLFKRPCTSYGNVQRTQIDVHKVRALLGFVAVMYPSNQPILFRVTLLALCLSWECTKTVEVALNNAKE